MDLFDKFSDLVELTDGLEKSGTNPFDMTIDRIISATEAVIGGRQVILAGTNNYLGLTFHPDCIAAACNAIKNEGTGTTGSRIANGSYAGHSALEKAFAEFFGTASAMIFTTGYQANLGVLAGLAGPGDFILIDADSHASIYDGCKMSGATIIRFRHNNAADLDKRLGRLGPDTNKLVVAEGIYSMVGDRAPLLEMVEAKNKHGAYLMVDEAHSLGVLGEHGRGLAEELGCLDDIDLIVGTFSKSLGAVGGFCASNLPLARMLKFSSSAYMFTASQSPANVASVLAALPLMRDGTDLRAKLKRNADRLHAGFTAAGFTVLAQNSPVLAVSMADQQAAIRFWNRLLDHGVYVNLAIPPGTPNGISIMRCSVSAAHSDQQIDRIVDAFKQVQRESNG